MPDLDDIQTMAGEDGNLAVLSVARADRSVHSSVVSAGVIPDPVDGGPGVGLVAMGGSVKLRLLRSAANATVLFKSGYRWIAVSGPTRLIGPDDGTDLGFDVPEVIRSVYRAAGGEHDDWDEFDRVMANDRRCAVFLRAERIYP
jgi:hypothetical protein